MSEVLVHAEQVSKKFCRSLKRSLWYGVQDMVREAIPVGNSRRGGNRGTSALRKDEFWAVNDVGFELRRGECLGLIGHNGAGKTTLLKMLNGLIKPDRGRITMRGRVGALIALGAGFNPVLTGRENIHINGSVLGLSKAELGAKVDEIIEFADIREFIDAPVRNYSSGMQIRLGFAVAVAFRPDILLLDEVLAVGDVAFQAKCFNTLSAFRAAGTGFILVSHNMHQISRHCDRVLYLNRGKIRVLGNTHEAVDAYNSDMSATAGGGGETTDFASAYGTGKVHITAARFLDAQGREVDRIRTGESVTLSLSYTCPAPPVRDVVLDIIIRDRDGVFFQGTNRDSNAVFAELGARGSVRVSFESIPANNGDLDFFVALMDHRTKEVFDWKRYIRLRVVGNSTSIGRVALPCRWEAASDADLSGTLASPGLPRSHA